MFDCALSTQIDRMGAAHQRHEDDQAEQQDRVEAEELAITKDPAAVALALDNFDSDGWAGLSLLTGKLIAQYQYHGDERDQGILDTAQEIYDLCRRAIAEQAAYNRQRTVRSADMEQAK